MMAEGIAGECERTSMLPMAEDVGTSTRAIETRTPAATGVFALATRGLEPVAAEEIGRIPGAVVLETAYRRVSARCADAGALLALRCVDDVFLEVASWSGIGRPRSVLAELTALASRLDLRPAQRACAAVRSIAARPTFSVTPSFVGKRNYGNEEIKAAIAGAVAARHGWEHRERDDESDLNLRVFIEHERAHLGVRLAARPLHERGYKRAHVPGSLRPSIAAAMVALARIGRGHLAVDPCCGAGTIVIEAGAAGACAIGGDIDPAAVAVARDNTASASASAVAGLAPPARWDARALPLADASVDRLVCNLPWGVQVNAGADIGDLYTRISAESLRVLAPGGVIVTLTHAPELLAFPGMARERTIEISVSGQTPVIAVFSSMSP